MREKIARILCFLGFHIVPVRAGVAEKDAKCQRPGCRYQVTRY